MKKKQEELVKVKGNMLVDEKKGLAFGVICNGFVPLKWMLHMQGVTRRVPGGLKWSWVYSIGDFKRQKDKSFTSLRTDVVRIALEMKAKYLFFVDSDVFVPYDTLSMLMAHDVDIVTGVYWMKTTPLQPVIYKKIGDGPIWNIKPSEKLLEIEGAGLGCCLIKTAVFEKFLQKKVPWFKQDWVDEKQNGLGHVLETEDHWFYIKAKELGFKIWCDTNVLCYHYDTQADTYYPNEEQMKKIIQGKMVK
jgi:hypothetical protein